MIKERSAEDYKCPEQNNCEVTALTRNICRACRYRKCLQAGMSIQGSRIGRQSNLFKHKMVEMQRQGLIRTRLIHLFNTKKRNTTMTKKSFDKIFEAEVYQQIVQIENAFFDQFNVNFNHDSYEVKTLFSFRIFPFVHSKIVIIISGWVVWLNWMNINVVFEIFSNKFRVTQFFLGHEKNTHAHFPIRRSQNFNFRWENFTRLFLNTIAYSHVFMFTIQQYLELSEYNEFIFSTKISIFLRTQSFNNCIRKSIEINSTR